MAMGVEAQITWSIGPPVEKGFVGMDGQTGSTGSPKGKGPEGMNGQAVLHGSAGSSEGKGFVVMDGQTGSTGSPEGKGPVGMDGQAEVIGSTGSVEMAGGAIVAASGSQEQNGPIEECLVENNKRRDCGWPGITQTECHRRGCCFNNVPSKSTWCFFRQELCPVRHGSRQSPRVPECNVDLPQARFGTPTVCPKPYPCTVWDKAQLGHNSALPLTPMCGDA
ncbi:Trefoil factor 3 [Branchiostoma belcheri]|nr:Trefoil factor 3 [Branchiostoma belcheri]